MPNDPLEGAALPHRPRHGPALGKADAARTHRDEPASWFNDPAIVSRIFYLLVGISVILLLIDPLISRNGSFAVERFFGFYGIFGLLAGAVLVLLAILLRRIVMRPEDYYDR